MSSLCSYRTYTHNIAPIVSSYACIYKGCGNGNNECDDYNRCVHYDKDDSTWRCGAPGLENEEEDKTMLRGEIVTKEE